MHGRVLRDLAPYDPRRRPPGDVGGGLRVDLPAALEGAERDGLAPPPRPRAPLARLAPKQLSSASTSPSKGLAAPQASAIRARRRP